MQNPVATAAFLATLNQLVVVPLSVAIDVKPYCNAPLRYKPFGCLLLFYTILTTLAMAAGPVHKYNKFELYLFPESFRLKELAVMYAAAVMYAIIVRIIKHFIVKHKQRRITPL